MLAARRIRRAVAVRSCCAERRIVKRDTGRGYDRRDDLDVCDDSARRERAMRAEFGGRARRARGPGSLHSHLRSVRLRASRIPYRL